MQKLVEFVVILGMRSEEEISMPGKPDKKARDITCLFRRQGLECPHH